MLQTYQYKVCVIKHNEQYCKTANICMRIFHYFRKVNKFIELMDAKY